MNSPETQVCNRCKIEKELNAFQLESKRANGRRAICRECRSVAHDPSKGVIPKTPEALAREQAIEELIEAHREHFSRLLYSVQVRNGLVEPGKRPTGDLDRQHFYRLGRLDRTAVDA